MIHLSALMALFLISCDEEEPPPPPALADLPMLPDPVSEEEFPRGDVREPVVRQTERRDLEPHGPDDLVDVLPGAVAQFQPAVVVGRGHELVELLHGLCRRCHRRRRVMGQPFSPGLGQCVAAAGPRCVQGVGCSGFDEEPKKVNLGVPHEDSVRASSGACRRFAD